MNSLITKEQSKRWNFPGKQAQKKAKTLRSAGKVMVSIFSDAWGITYIY